MPFCRFKGIVLVAEDVNDLYLRAIDHVLTKGSQSQPRGKRTIEVTHAILQILDPRKRLVTIQSRKTNPGFAIADWLWTMLGTDDGTIPIHYNYKMSFLVKQPPAKLEYSYGGRLRNWHGIDQLEAAKLRLQRDLHSRRAVCVLFNPVTDHLAETNVPCVLLVQFLLRKRVLDLTVYVRSNDLILGLVYDVFTFSLIQEVMAGWLGCDVGTYTHIADSLHIYEKDVSFAKNILSNRDGANLYHKHKVSDMRVSRQDYDATLMSFVAIEHLAREAPLDNANRIEGIVNTLPESWRRMAYCILAYNLHKSSSPSQQDTGRSFMRYLKLTDPHYAYLLTSRYGGQYGITPDMILSEEER